MMCHAKLVSDSSPQRKQYLPVGKFTQMQKEMEVMAVPTSPQFKDTSLVCSPTNHPHSTLYISSSKRVNDLGRLKITRVGLRRDLGCQPLASVTFAQSSVGRACLQLLQSNAVVACLLGSPWCCPETKPHPERRCVWFHRWSSHTWNTSNPHITELCECKGLVTQVKKPASSTP